MLLLYSCLLLVRAPALGQTPREPLAGTTPYVYRSIGSLQLDLQVLSPDSSFARPRPAIIYFFGGGWNKGSVKQFVPFGEELTKRGMVSIFVDYRVASRNHTTPYDAVDDARAAMRWVKSHASELGVDPKRIVAAGGSAGGHLALMTTVGPPEETGTVSSAASLLIGYNPVADVRDARWADRFGAKASTISPTAHVRPGLPDTLLFHGEVDTTVPIQQVRDFCAAMVKAGNHCTVSAFEGAKHGFFNVREQNKRWYPRVMEQTIEFLRKHGYVE